MPEEKPPMMTATQAREEIEVLGFDFPTLIQLVLAVLNNPTLMELVRKLFSKT